MNKDKLASLKNIKTPSPSKDARSHALDLAMQAYDAASTKNTADTQASGLGARLMSILNWTKGISIMDQRFPIAASLSALLLIPASVYLLNTTSLTPATVPSTVGGEIAISPDQNFREMEEAPRPEPLVKTTPKQVEGLRSVDTMANAGDQTSPRKMKLERQQSVALSAPAQPTTSLTTEQIGNIAAGGRRGADLFAASPSSGDRFQSFADDKVKSVVAEPVSTFSIDVDTASYAYVRRMLEAGQLPNPDAVRVEELINYFSYDYAAPTSAETPFATHISVVPSPFDAGKQFVRIGIKGYEVPPAERQPANLVFLIDTSGSMNAPDKLPLLKRSFALLLDQLDERDTIAIVTYAGAAGTVLEPTSATNKAVILRAIEALSPGGSTAGADGIVQAYRLAESVKTKNSVSRVILATDGDFNVGISSPTGLERLIEEKRNAGVFLSVLGFGTGNLNDHTMQTLAQNGNGAAYYIDSFREAQKVLATEVGATLVPIAKDVKIQVEFNPESVAEYRLIGYETRALDREDFNNDHVDAGDVGSGHTVTAFYEITPVGSQSLSVDPLRYGTAEQKPAPLVQSDEIGFFKLRYKLPNEDISRLMTAPINNTNQLPDIAAADDDARFAIAVTAFAQKLRGNIYASTISYAQIKTMAAAARGEDIDGYRAEFISLIDIAKSLDPE